MHKVNTQVTGTKIDDKTQSLEMKSTSLDNKTCEEVWKNSSQELQNSDCKMAVKTVKLNLSRKSSVEADPNQMQRHNK